MKNSIDLFSSSNDAIVISSLDIATLTDKRHSDVLRDIRKMLIDLELDSTHFCAQYNDSTGRPLPMFKLPERECLILASGYNIKLRAAIIDELARMKKEKSNNQTKLPQTFSEALQLAADQAKQLELQAPKVESYDMFIDSSSLQGFKEVANLLGLGRNTLMSKLRELKIITSKNIPYQQYLNMGLFEVKESTQNGFNIATTYVTPKGIEYIKKKVI